MKKAALSLEMIVVYLLAIGFAVVIIFLILMGKGKIGDLIATFTGLR